MEAITRKKEVDEMKRKTLAKEIPTVGITIENGEVANLDPISSGWNVVPGSSNVYYETYIDLAGMSMEEKTMFFSGATTQNMNPITSNPAVAGNNVHVWDLMVTKPLSLAELIQVVVFGNTASPGVKLTFDQTVYFRNRVLNTDIDNAASTIMIPIFDEQLGSLEATASDRIYIYRYISIVGADGVYNIYPVRFILQAEAKEEPEYQYLMRLKRSYELQNEPDRD